MRSCCQRPDPLHRLDEVGNAIETHCAQCRRILATLYRDETGHRRWLHADGRTSEHGITARRPDQAHTCHSQSSVPCPACLRAREGDHLGVRRVLDDPRTRPGRRRGPD